MKCVCVLVFNVWILLNLCSAIASFSEFKENFFVRNTFLQIRSYRLQKSFIFWFLISDNNHFFHDKFSGKMNGKCVNKEVKWLEHRNKRTVSFTFTIRKTRISIYFIFQNRILLHHFFLNWADVSWEWNILVCHCSRNHGLSKSVFCFTLVLFWVRHCKISMKFIGIPLELEARFILCLLSLVIYNNISIIGLDLSMNVTINKYFALLCHISSWSFQKKNTKILKFGSEQITFYINLSILTFIFCFC